MISSIDISYTFPSIRVRTACQGAFACRSQEPPHGQAASNSRCGTKSPCVTVLQKHLRALVGALQIEGHKTRDSADLVHCRTEGEHPSVNSSPSAQRRAVRIASCVQGCAASGCTPNSNACVVPGKPATRIRRYEHIPIRKPPWTAAADTSRTVGSRPTQSSTARASPGSTSFPISVPGWDRRSSSNALCVVDQRSSDATVRPTAGSAATQTTAPSTTRACSSGARNVNAAGPSCRQTQNLFKVGAS